jgi:hypothetical protein
MFQLALMLDCVRAPFVLLRCVVQLLPLAAPAPQPEQYSGNASMVSRFHAQGVQRKLLLPFGGLVGASASSKAPGFGQVDFSPIVPTCPACLTCSIRCPILGRLNRPPAQD